MLTITSPYVQIADLNGDPLDDGSIYIGTAGLNAETNPITVYWDAAGTQPAAQPIKTRSGVVARNGSPARVYINAASYSLTVRDKQGRLLASELSISSSVDASGITDGTIAEVKLDAALAAKINGALQKSGGTMTGALTLAGDATLALQPATKQQLDAVISPGAVQAFAMSAAPTGWLKANGAAVSRTTYAALFAAIGTAFGAGDGSTTFNLPDLRGEFVRGWDDGRGVDIGRVFGSAQADELKSHTHSIPMSDVETGADRPTVGSGFVGDFQTTATGGSETRPRNVALLYCIKF